MELANPSAPKLTTFQISQHVRFESIRAVLYDCARRNTIIPNQPKHVLPSTIRQWKPRRHGEAAHWRRLIDTRSQPTTKASVLGARMQRTTVFHLQQPSTTPEREVRNGSEIVLPQVRRGIHQNHRQERPPGARQVHQATTSIGRQVTTF